MSNKLLSLIIFWFCLITNPIFANCNFNTSSQIDNLKDINKIKNIEIKVINNRKWSKNALNIIKDKNSIIQVKHKKKFKADIKIIYDFGICYYNGKIRINGDKKDHLDLSDGKLKASLDVQLINGNLNSSTKFKLFLPKTRNGNNEIFTTLLLKKLGFISPDTFYVNIKLNELEYKVLFQEKSVKELLERNSRVEGPIFEGDEELLWKNKKANNEFASMQLEKLSGSRLTNKKWASKNINTAVISLKSFINLQKAYFNFSLEDISYFIDPNIKKNNLFALYDLTLMSMAGFHGLRPHNRKFYYNTQRQIFEPIYYDGETHYEENILNNLSDVLNKNDTYLYSDSFQNENINQILNRIDLIDIDEFTRNYSDFSKLEFFEAKKEVRNNIEIIKKNLKIIEEYFENFKKYNHKKKIINKDWLKQAYELENNYDLIQKYVFVENVNFEDKNFSINCYSKKDCLNDTINLIDLINLMENNIYLDSRALIYEANSKILKNKIKVTKNINNNFEIISSITANIRYDKKNKSLYLEQKYSDDWFLIKDHKIEKIVINFEGVKDNKKNNYKFEGISQNGLTGCLTFYNVELKDVSFNLKKGECEDSINFILTNGKIDSLTVEDAKSDGVDFDFSNLTINKVDVKNSINDCLDFSYGKYTVEKVDVLKCGDKGISIGENSIFKAENVFIKESNIGIASKDSSKVHLTNVNIDLVKSCLTANKKKQEFHGAKITTDYLNCKNYEKKIVVGKNSSIVVN